MKLKISVKELAPCEKILTIDVPSENIREAYEHVYGEIAKVAKVPGFRPGKAPRNVISVHYRDEAREEVLKKLVSKSLREALQEKNIQPVINPEIRELDFTEEKLSYQAHVETRPQVKLGSYLGIQVRKNPVRVELPEIDQVIEKLREGYAKFIPVEDRGLQFGDFMIADLKVAVDGKQIESRQDDWIEFREKGFLPDFSAALLGSTPGTAKDIEVNFPKDYAKKDLAGKKGIFKIKIKEIKKRELPAVETDWAREVGEYQSVDELREAIKKDLESEKETQEEHHLQNEILETLIRSSSFDIPQGMVERRLNQLVEQAVRNMVYQGVPQEEAVKQKDSIREKLKPEAEKQVRLSFILDLIAEKEKIEVTEEDLEKRWVAMARELKQTKEKIVEYYESEGLMEGLALQILNQKVAAFLREKAEVTEKSFLEK